MPPELHHAAFEDNWQDLKTKINLIPNYKEHWPELVPFFEQVSLQNTVLIMIWNMLTNSIVYAVDCKGVTGHSAAKYLGADGISFTISNCHPEFIDAALKQQQNAARYFIDTPKEHVKKIVVSLESLSKRITGKYFHLLQQTVAIEIDSEGNPFLFLSCLYDVSHIKKHGTINMVITMPDQVKWWNFNFEKHRLEFIKPLSKQERTILFLLAEGMSSKEIAKELYISSFTVDTHRKNLLRKTNCVNTTGMVTYARLVGLL